MAPIRKIASLFPFALESRWRKGIPLFLFAALGLLLFQKNRERPRLLSLATLNGSVTWKAIEQVVAALQEVVWVRDAQSSRVVYVNPAYEQLWGRETGTLYENPLAFLDAIHPEDKERMGRALDKQNLGLAQEQEYRIVPPDGNVRYIGARTFPVCDELGKLAYIVTIARDISQQKLDQEALLYDALHDGLTGLPNRMAFMDRVEQAIKRARRNLETGFAVLFIDLDRFKAVNDSLGHAAGDRLLTQVAPRLSRCLRSVDTVARLGGDEFVILLDEINDVHGAQEVVERLLADLAHPFELDGNEVFVSASVGIAVGGSNYERAEDVLRDADIAMYRAKLQGKAQFAVFDLTMRENILARLTLEADLHRALERNEFDIYYQPVVSLQTGLVTALEALVRWRHPTRGLMDPDQFVNVAEESGLMVQLDRWVMRNACQQMTLWQQHFPSDPSVGLNVNLSSHHLTRPDLVDYVSQVLRETRLDPSLLRIEISETAIIENRDLAPEVLRRLYLLGVQVQIDNFGQGLSSVGMLLQLPVNAIKIDRSLGGRIGTLGDKTEIVETIVTLAHNLGIDVVVEGIETAAQLKSCKAFGSAYAQGYVFSSPVDCRKAEQILASHQEFPV